MYHFFLENIYDLIFFHLVNSQIVTLSYAVYH